jgi:hypothetical protein
VPEAAVDRRTGLGDGVSDAGEVDEGGEGVLAHVPQRYGSDGGGDEGAS